MECHKHIASKVQDYRRFHLSGDIQEGTVAATVKKLESPARNISQTHTTELHDDDHDNHTLAKTTQVKQLTTPVTHLTSEPVMCTTLSREAPLTQSAYNTAQNSPQRNPSSNVSQYSPQKGPRNTQAHSQHEPCNLLKCQKENKNY